MSPRLAAAVCAGALALAGPAGAARSVPAVSCDARAFRVAGTPVFLYAGTFRYVRCPRALWEDRMLRIRAAGFNAIVANIPWNWHEPEEGRRDLSDLEEWLDLAGRLGFLVIARPGPYVDSGWDAGGFPAWLAGRDIGWRTDSSASVKWSKKWLKAVLPVLAKHQASEGGPVILVQLEHDADNAGIPAEVMARYLVALADVARHEDLEVPLLTCRSGAARADKGARRLIDTCGFGPGDDAAAAERAVAELRRARPDAPVAVMEIRRGGSDRAADGALAMTLVTAGASVLNVDPAAVGTHQAYWTGPGDDDAGAPDVAAPIAETGALTEAWDAAKLLGDFLRTYGSFLVRAIPEEGGRADPGQVTVRSRGDGAARIVLARNDSKRAVTARVTAPGGTPLGLTLGPRAAKLLVAGAEVDGLAVDRCAAQVQAVVRQGGRRVLLLADEPGTWALQARLDGEAVKGNASWGREGKLTVLPGGLTVWGQPPSRAARTWVVETSRGPAIVSTGAYFLRHWGEQAGKLVLHIDSLPGSTTLRVLVPGSAPTLFETPLWTRALPFPPVALKDFRVATERPGDGTGWKRVGTPAPLGALGCDANTFVRYRTRFAWNGEPGLGLGFLDDDPHLVFVNGVFLPGVSGTARTGIAPLASVAKKGDNLLEILLENRGRPDSGPGMEAPKGLARAVLVSSTTAAGAAAEKTIDGWEFAPRLARGWERGDGPDWTDWRAGTPLPPAVSSGGPVVWFRTRFTLSAAPGWNVPRKLVLRSRHNARIFLNGIEIGSTGASGDPAGAVSPAGIYLAEQYLKFGSLDNELAIAVVRGAAPVEPISASVEPCREASTYTHILEVPL